ncbi:hypothetical protein AAZU54_01385 [Pseudomonas sp. Je.1.5.c]|uniref:hypothetical protein n=1 Tax=Pseudomonas sp. Je.1.5.c TaxID=3142839 RepID=UPI003DA9100A
MNDHCEKDEHMVSFKEVVNLTAPLHDAITALAVSVIKLSSVISLMDDKDAQKEGLEAFDNIDNVVAELERFNDLVLQLSNGKNTDHG